jgi:hypothetical protein
MKGIEQKGIIVRAQISSDRCRKQKFIERSREEKKWDRDHNNHNKTKSMLRMIIRKV